MHTRTISWKFDKRGVARAVVHPAFALKVKRGPDARRERRFAKARVKIGTHSDADFPLTDPTVSSVHCEILALTDGLRVRDLGAKNGVRVGGRRVLEAWLEPNDEIELGDTTVRFKLLDEDEEELLDDRKAFGRLKGASPAMRQLYTQLERAAKTDVTVLLQGETGTGKELAAEAIVSHGPRRDRPFVVVDCGRLVSTLAESELFGHEANAFTGATRAHPGAFERAHGGTVFLDELGELPLDLQPKLLGVLERRTVQRVGGSAAIPIDVRVIAATHRELEREVNRGTFRADLYFRVAVTELRLPPLSARREDIALLVQHFLDELPGTPSLSATVLERLSAHDWPGNVRELRNAVERAAVGLDLPLAAAAPEGAPDFATPFRLQKERLINGFERSYLVGLLQETKGNVSEAARRSGLSRARLYEMLNRWQLV